MLRSARNDGDIDHWATTQDVDVNSAHPSCRTPDIFTVELTREATKGYTEEQGVRL